MAYLAQDIPQQYIWYVYFAAVLFLAYRLLRPGEANEGEAKETARGNLKAALILAVPISILSGLLGVGPGFLLMPTLILLGFASKKAAGINALAVTPPSFSALIPYMGTASIDPMLAAVLIVVGAAGSFLGARLTSLYVPGQRLKQLFGVVVTAYKIFTMAV